MGKVLDLKANLILLEGGSQQTPYYKILFVAVFVKVVAFARARSILFLLL